MDGSFKKYHAANFSLQYIYVNITVSSNDPATSDFLSCIVIIPTRYITDVPNLFRQFSTKSVGILWHLQYLLLLHF